MAAKKADLKQVLESLEALRAEVGRLNDRIATLESRAVPAGDKLDEDVVIAIGAAVAAFLGKKAHIRQIRLLGGASWAHQGRATIHASHALKIQRD